MTIGFPSVRIDEGNALHHLWCNNGTWWVHYTLHYDFRRRRVRRSLGTRSLDEAIRRRDELLARLARDGEPVPERGSVTLEQPIGPGSSSAVGGYSKTHLHLHGRECIGTRALATLRANPALDLPRSLRADPGRAARRLSPPAATPSSLP